MNRLSIALLVMLVVCALSVVTAQNRARKVFVALDRAQVEARQAAVDWNRLEVEQSALTKNSLVDGRARRSLAMQVAGNERTLHLSLGGEPTQSPTRTASAVRQPR